MTPHELEAALRQPDFYRAAVAHAEAIVQEHIDQIAPGVKPIVILGYGNANAVVAENAIEAFSRGWIRQLYKLVNASVPNWNFGVLGNTKWFEILDEQMKNTDHTIFLIAWEGHTQEAPVTPINPEEGD